MIILFLIPVPHRQLHVRCTPYEYTIWVTIVFLPTLCTLVERPSSPITMAVCAYRIRAVSHRFLSQKCMVLLHHTLQADFDFALFTISPPLKDSKLFSNAIVHPYIIVLTMYDCIYAPLKYMYQYMFLLCWHAQSFFYQNSKDITRKKITQVPYVVFKLLWCCLLSETEAFLTWFFPWLWHEAVICNVYSDMYCIFCRSLRIVSTLSLKDLDRSLVLCNGV